MTTKSILLVLAVLASFSVNTRSHAAKPAARNNPLASLPSASGEHIARIQALAAGQWLELDTPAEDPKWGAARGRAWGPRMAYAADLGGAFYCGTGVHGFVKPDGHYMDDLWFFDIRGNRWICLYPGASKQTQLKLDKHGFEVLPSGEHNPVSYLSHAYYNITYDDTARKFMLIYTDCPWWSKGVPQRADWLDIPIAKRGNVFATGNLNRDIRHPVFWDVAKAQWQRRFVPGEAGPRGNRCLGVLEYVPSLKQTLFLWRGKVGYYDHFENSWRDADAPASPISGYDLAGALDTRRNQLWVGKGNAFAAYDLEENTWSDSTATRPPVSIPGAHSGTLTYDAAADALLYCRYKRRSDETIRLGIYVFDLATRRWSEKPIVVPELPKHLTMAAFYDAQLNAHFLYIAGDSRSKDARMLVYRHALPQREGR